MKLTSIQVENFRSILTTQSLKLDKNLTVIVGPNNEGKSNLLRAIVLAMECLRAFLRPSRMNFRLKEAGLLRLQPDLYDWENDFPLGVQKKLPDGNTILTLSFELSNHERVSFQKACGSAINGDLPIKISIGAQGAKFKVKKPGRGAKVYEENSNKIAQFISRNFKLEYIPAIRPSLLSLEVIGNLLERELGVLSEEPSFKDALKTIDELQKPIYARLEENVQTQLRKLLPSVKKVKISLPQGVTYRGRFRSPQLIIDDGTATSIESKGDGVKSLAAISLMRASSAGDKVESLVVAIEEPESHLHPEAIRQLASVLREMSTEHQVIITTHSPLLVARNRIEANIIVNRSQATPATSIKALRDSLGVQVADNLVNAEYVILVEGKTDLEILTAVFRTRSQKFDTFLAEGKIVFDDMGGTGKIGYKISSLSQAVTTQILITDDDRAGKDADKKAGQAGLTDKQRFTWKRPSALFRSTELEDLIDPNVYWEALQKDFGVVLDQQKFKVLQDSWSERMKIIYEAGGKRWNSQVEMNMKNTIAKKVSQNPTNAIANEYELLIDNVISATTEIIFNSQV